MTNIQDVLLGRGGAINRHPGNQRFRALVAKHKPAFAQTKVRRDKRAIAKCIVNEIHNLQPPGRFLTADGNSDSTDRLDDDGVVLHPPITSKVWVRVDADKALAKVMHRLRDKEWNRQKRKKDEQSLSSNGGMNRLEASEREAAQVLQGLLGVSSGQASAAQAAIINTTPMGALPTPQLLQLLSQSSNARQQQGQEALTAQALIQAQAASLGGSNATPAPSQLIQLLAQASNAQRQAQQARAAQALIQAQVNLESNTGSTSLQLAETLIQQQQQQHRQQQLLLQVQQELQAARLNNLTFQALQPTSTQQGPLTAMGQMLQLMQRASSQASVPSAPAYASKPTDRAANLDGKPSTLPLHEQETDKK